VVIISSKQYRFGRAFEYSCQAKLRKLGYYVIRSYGSKGLYDLVAVPPRVPVEGYPSGTLLIQCKTTKDPKKEGYVKPEERQALADNSSKWLGTTIVMHPKNRRIVWYEIR